MKSHEWDSKVQELEIFLIELREYYNWRHEMNERNLTKKEAQHVSELRRTLVKKAGKNRELISEITKIDKVPIVLEHKEYLTDIWTVGLLANPVRRTTTALNYCIDSVGQAIGKLEDDIEKGLRDKQGNLIEKPRRIAAEPPKAFIAHGGDSSALSKLKSFLWALGVEPLVVEEQPSEGRSVAENVDWYSRQADCAIILATKGDIDARTGSFIPRGNVLMETGKLQEIFKDRIVYLLQAGTKFPTNISEKVRERFTSQNMDNAFIKIAKELKKFGILRAVKP